MSIVTKGPRNMFVIERNNVPVKDICDSVAEHKTLSWLQQRYGVQRGEVFECLDAYVDMSDDDNNNLLALAVYRDDQQKLAGIETVAINDRVYFAVLCYGTMFYPHIDCFNELFAASLNLIVVESLLDVKSGIAEEYTDRSFIHSVVLTALEKSTGVTVDQHNVDQLLQDLDYETVLRELGK